jgi:tetratricopeptide (TPR) repeat protein
MENRNTKYIWAGIIFIVAIAARLVYFTQVKANFPGWDTPTIDPLYHDLWAKQIAAGHILGAGAFFRAPFYAYFLGLIYAIFGPSLAVAKVIQHLIGAATCSLIFLFTDKYFDRKAAILSAFLATFNWVLIYHEDELLLDSLLVLFSLAIIWSLIISVEKPKSWRFFASGILLGLASITRPNYLAFWPVILIWLWLIFRPDYGKAIKRFLILSLGCTLMIAPIALRNKLIGHDNVLIASQGGINFYIGNNPHADGVSAIMPEFGSTWQYSDAEYMAKSETGKLGQEMKPSEVSSFYYRKGIDFAVNRPLAWLGLTVKKFGLFWNSFEVSNNQDLYFFRRFATITKILPPLFFIISPFSLIGLALIFRFDKKYHILGYFAIVYMLTIIGFFVNSRFRLPVLPLLIILASVAFWQAVDWLRARSIKKAVIFLAALIVLFFMTNIDFYGISHESFAMSYFSLGNVYLKKGLSDKALDEYSEALKLAKCVPKAHLNRGAIYFSRHDFKSARQEFELELSACQVSAEAHNNLSVLDRLEGNPETALQEAREAINIMPQYLEARINVILALRALKDNKEAYEVVDSLTFEFPDYLPGHYFKGKMLSEQGLDSQAMKELYIIISHQAEDIVERYDLSTIYSMQSGYGYKPEKIAGLANYEMGLLRVRAGDIDSALICFKNATTDMPDYADAWTNLALAYDHKQLYNEALAAFKNAIEHDRANPLVYYNCGLTLGKLGRLTDASQFFQQALDLKPDFTEAKEKLKVTETLLKSSSKK